VARSPGPRIQAGETGIVPADHRLIRRHLLEVPVQAEVFTEALVDATDVRIPVRAPLSGYNQPAVYLREKRPIRVRIVEDIGARDAALRRHRRIRAAGPAYAEEGGGDAHCLRCAVHVVRPPRTGRSGRL